MDEEKAYYCFSKWTIHTKVIDCQRELFPHTLRFWSSTVHCEPLKFCLFENRSLILPARHMRSLLNPSEKSIYISYLNYDISKGLRVIMSIRDIMPATKQCAAKTTPKDCMGKRRFGAPALKNMGLNRKIWWMAIFLAAWTPSPNYSLFEFISLLRGISPTIFLYDR